MKKALPILLALMLLLSCPVRAAEAEEPDYLITFTTADGVVTSGYRESWRWMAFSRSDTGRPSIPLTDHARETGYVNGPRLTRSDEGTDTYPATAEALVAWGKDQDGKPCTLTLGRESWDGIARFKDYSTEAYPDDEKVLYIEFLRDEEAHRSLMPDGDTMTLYRYGWAQERDREERKRLATTGFTDVDASDWFAPYVKVCVERGLMNGVGGDRFGPNETFTNLECLTAALRLFDLQNDGDGALPQAPESWGRAELVFADGTGIVDYGSCYEVFGHDSEVPFYYFIPRESPEAESWGKAHEGPATLTLEEDSYPGTVACVPWYDEYWKLDFTPDDPGAAEAIRADMERRAPINAPVYSSAPAPDKWWRNTIYALYRLMEEGKAPQNCQLQWMAGREPYPAERQDFAGALDIAAGELEAINDIQRLPDTDYTEVLRLYNAGILTGTDPYGTFYPKGTLTRAEAAAMLARVMEPSLRVGFAPQPLPTGGNYTLTYLADGTADCGVSYPVVVSGGYDGGVSGILFLDGTVMDWPGTVPSFGLDQQGKFCYIAPWKEGGPSDRISKTAPGLLGTEGWVVPIGEYDILRVLGWGILAGKETGNGSEIAWWFLDDDGTILEDKGVTQNGAFPYPYDSQYFETFDETPRLEHYQGITSHRFDVDDEGYAYYLNYGHAAVSQKFDWCGDIGPDGRGFVGLDGKIYRIEFQ